MIAIIIPYYKLTFFDATLESLANQTDTRFKVYIGDDASPENPEVLLEKYNGQFDFVYHRFENNLGGISLTQQWERCIALSSNEEWIMILGDDDVLGVNVLEAFCENLEEIKTAAKVVRFASAKINGKGDSVSSPYYHPKIEKTNDFLFRNTRSSLSEYVFYKKHVLDIGFKNFPVAWFSDVLAVLEFSDFKNVFSINEAQVYIRITDLSISGKKNNLKLKQKATFDFYYYLLIFKSNYFNRFQRKKLFKQINKSYTNDKKNYMFFFKLTYFYCSRLLVIEYFQFLRSVFVNIINIKCE